MKKYLIALLLAASSHVARAAPPTFDEALAVLSEKVRNWDATALNEADQVLALAQTDEQKARVLLRIGDSLLTQHKPAMARQRYEKALRLPGLNSDLQNTALVMLATTYQLQQPADYERARATLRRIVDGEQFSVRDKTAAQLQIASAYQSAGDNAAARALWQSVARDEKTEVWARLSAFLSLAEMERFGQNFAAALANYKQALALAPDDITIKAIVLDGVAQVYLEQKNFVRARQQFAETLKIDIKKAPAANRPALEMLRANAQMDIAKSYASQGDKKRARAEYAKVSAMPGSQLHAAQIKSELEQLDRKPEKEFVFD